MVSKLQETKLTGIEEIPTGWEVRQLGELFDFSGGMPFSRSALGEEGFLYLHYGDIHKRNQNMFSTSDDFNWLPKIDIGIEDVKDYALLTTGDVVFADASEDYEGIGKSVVIVNDENKPFISGLHTIVAREREQRKLLDIDYKRYFLTPKFVRDQFVKIATGATVFGISKTNIKQIKILVPPIPEQKEIATILSSVDKAIQKTKSIIEQIEKMKKGLMQQLLGKGIGHTKFKKTAVGEIPEEWEVVSIGEVAEVRNGTTPSRSNSIYWDGGTIPWIKTGQVHDLFITNGQECVTLEAVEKTSLRILPVNTILIAMIGQGITRGKAAMLTIPATINQNFAAIVTKNVINPTFLLAYLEKSYDEIRSSGRGSNQGALNCNIVRAIKFPLPPKEEQDQISATWNNCIKRIEVEKSYLNRLENLKKGLTQVILIGKVRVKVDEAEVTQV
ncbi:restriction endonuclease subunit S [Bacillus mycoides]|uniref:restriction endonuclease subunit S n=1 Tax=Bacillus mycoides TaxID=1405 RepID=UPI0002799753|nr:restriction endonuclease subunit S [Bacillus mycoides]EJS10509.1 hypothetical protein IKO_00730 [Bacillus cereus VDM034]QWI21023.1 restriction endonuclease subunit S [Bacillus mycoides]